MSGRAESLCIEFLDLALAQRAALAQGELDEASALMEKRRALLDRIQNIDRERPPLSVLSALAAIDQEIANQILSEMESVLAGLETIRNIRKFLETAQDWDLHRRNSRIA